MQSDTFDAGTYLTPFGIKFDAQTIWENRPAFGGILVHTPVLNERGAVIFDSRPCIGMLQHLVPVVRFAPPQKVAAPNK